MEQFKVSEEDWQKIERLAKNPAAYHSRAVCELRDRVAELEKKARTAEKCNDAICRRLDEIRRKEPASTEESSAAQSDPAMTALERPRDWYPDFADWLERQMPEGTVIGDPLWWASCIANWLIAKATLGPEPNLHGIALDMVDSLRPIVIPEILNVLRRAIREPMAEQQAAAEATPEPEPSPSPAADGGLEDVIAGIIGNEPIIGRPCPAAGAVILAVAKWLRSMGHFSAATNLEREANR